MQNTVVNEQFQQDAVRRQLGPAVAQAAEAACRKIAPLWPLKHFVAVNPFLGLADTPFAEAAGIMARTAGARMTLPRSEYRTAIAAGRVRDEDLSAALSAAAGAGEIPESVAALKAAAQQDGASTPVVLSTVADVARDVTDNDWNCFVVERISGWCAAFFDEGQAVWPVSHGGGSFYAAWRQDALIDRTPELSGLKGFRKTIAGLPAEADAVLIVGTARLGLSQSGLEAYFHRLLMTIGGWAGFARYRLWEAELHGGDDLVLTELLSVRVAWDLAILEALTATTDIGPAWARARLGYAEEVQPTAGQVLDGILHSALERAWQRELIEGLVDPQSEADTAMGRKSVQAAFCIDVRSEIFRRALEKVSPQVETIGFAGFFGFPIEYVPVGQTHGGKQCPVLLTPSVTIAETANAGDPANAVEIGRTRLLRRRAAQVWKSFKMAAVSSFAFVETIGLAYIGKIVTDGFGLTRPVPHPASDGLKSTCKNHLAPSIDEHELSGRVTGIPPEVRLEMAETVLKAMSMTDNLARIVLLAGHGSSTVNNPHATGLDCGACGGHTGEANARVAAAVLNDPTVRQGLAARGLAIPQDTIFLAALHDTTTDEVIVYEDTMIPAGHVQELILLKRWLVEAAQLARTERAALLNIDPGRPVDLQIQTRSRDWSQVRPEWGLAGCAAFVAAPRERTQKVDLHGRSFLHSYDWRKDEDFGILELIMTAPMVVASWISLQYFGSSVDNRIFGSGNKVLHNVTGTIGVLEGNGGDLRVGLPLQSVHDGERLVHEPLRLSVFIEAPTDAMNTVIEKHEGVRQLVDNGWLYLFALAEEGRTVYRYTGDLTWEPASATMTGEATTTVGKKAA